MAILGPSGAGKSTFLDVISQRRSSSNLEGEIIYNDQQIKQIKHLSSYIQQEEVFIGSLTVRETIEYAAALNVKNNERDKVKKRVD